jgi:hypothetical protein
MSKETPSAETVLSRRSFLKLAGATAVAGLVVPAWTPPHKPYVHVGQVVDYIGPALHGFIGSTLGIALSRIVSLKYARSRRTVGSQSKRRQKVAAMPVRIYPSVGKSEP